MATTQNKEKKRVLIAGAGIGGIALAEALAQQQELKDVISIHLYERDSNPSSRSQGLVIGLRQEALDILIGKLGWSRLSKLFHPQGPKNVAMILAGNSSRPLMVIKNLLRIKVADDELVSSLVNRSELRAGMLEALMKNHSGKQQNQVDVKFNKRIIGYDEDATGVNVRFEDGSTERFDALVAADGARSLIREKRCPALVPVELGFWTDAGYHLLEPEHRLDKTSNELLKLSYSSLVRKSGQLGCSWLSFVHWKSDTEHSLLWSISMPQAVADKYNLQSDLPPEQMKSISITLARELISDEAAELITLTKVSEMFPGYKFYSVLPATFSSPPLLAGDGVNSLVTLIGDAAHKTTTQAGLGSTAALMDAMLVAECIAKFKTKNDDIDLHAAFQKYNKEMVVFSKQAVEASVGNTERIHSTSTFGQIMFRIIGGFMGYALGGWYYLTGQ